jgi:hypothetical protein
VAIRHEVLQGSTNVAAWVQQVVIVKEELERLVEYVFLRRTMPVQVSSDVVLSHMRCKHEQS